MRRAILGLACLFFVATPLRADVPDGKEHTNSLGMKLVRVA